jgi:hypothetical protein
MKDRQYNGQKIPKGKSEAVNQWKTDNAMAKRYQKGNQKTDNTMAKKKRTNTELQNITH